MNTAPTATIATSAVIINPNITKISTTLLASIPPKLSTTDFNASAKILPPLAKNSPAATIAASTSPTIAMAALKPAAAVISAIVAITERPSIPRPSITADQGMPENSLITSLRAAAKSLPPIPKNSAPAVSASDRLPAMADITTIAIVAPISASVATTAKAIMPKATNVSLIFTPLKAMVTAAKASANLTPPISKNFAASGRTAVPNNRTPDISNNGIEATANAIVPTTARARLAKAIRTFLGLTPSMAIVTACRPRAYATPAIVKNSAPAKRPRPATTIAPLEAAANSGAPATSSPNVAKIASPIDARFVTIFPRVILPIT